MSKAKCGDFDNILTHELRAAHACARILYARHADEARHTRLSRTTSKQEVFVDLHGTEAPQKNLLRNDAVCPLLNPAWDSISGLQPCLDAQEAAAAAHKTSTSAAREPEAAAGFQSLKFVCVYLFVCLCMLRV